jgi:hypothetical protein
VSPFANAIMLSTLGLFTHLAFIPSLLPLSFSAFDPNELSSEQPPRGPPSAAADGEEEGESSFALPAQQCSPGAFDQIEAGVGSQSRSQDYYRSVLRSIGIADLKNIRVPHCSQVNGANTAHSNPFWLTLALLLRLLVLHAVIRRETGVSRRMVVSVLRYDIAAHTVVQDDNS